MLGTGLVITAMVLVGLAWIMSIVTGTTDYISPYISPNGEFCV